MNEIDLDMYSDPKFAEPVVPQEMRICEVNHVVLRPNVAYIFTVAPDCKARAHTRTSPASRKPPKSR